ncbi:pescadillo [Pseudozyma hubeiensis SY62]|uniref:Pescadillo n=1 Tax=Pseudozyma hubeiensis (strain SY62) TaxID=1305764 RepID=R9P823_PSEHS|nr:pescadillo [Pseudozyma hubeiensis SY62]GAC97516.1 pescadillo [Pseudozyma hubeiensis SY62]
MTDSQASANIQSHQQTACWNWGASSSEVDSAIRAALVDLRPRRPILAISMESTMMATMQGMEPSTKTKTTGNFGNTPELLGDSSLDSICLTRLQIRADLQGSAVGLTPVPEPQSV